MAATHGKLPQEPPDWGFILLIGWVTGVGGNWVWDAGFKAVPWSPLPHALADTLPC